MAAHDPKQIWFNREINQRLEEVLRSIAASHLNLVENGMRFQKLKQDRNILRLANGIIIDSSISFGRQTSRIYVPPPVPPKPVEIEEENVFILIITREWDDAPLTPENLDMMPEGGSSGNIEIDTKEGDVAVYFWGDRDEYFGNWVSDGDTKTYIAKEVYGPDGWVVLDKPTWLMKYNYTNNTWMVNILKGFESPSGLYNIIADFAEKTIATYYPRRYTKSYLPYAPRAKAVPPGRYRMTIPYYEVEEWYEYTNASRTESPYFDDRFKLDFDLDVPPYVYKKIRIKTTIPVAITPHLTHKWGYTQSTTTPSAGNNDTNIINPWTGCTFRTKTLTLPYIFNVPSTEGSPAYVGLHNCGGGVLMPGVDEHPNELSYYWRTETSTIHSPIAASDFGMMEHYISQPVPYKWFDMTIGLYPGSEETTVSWYGGTYRSAYRAGTVYGDKTWHFPAGLYIPEIREDGTAKRYLLEVEGYVSVTASQVIFGISVDDRNIIGGWGVTEDLEPTGVVGGGWFKSETVSFSATLDFDVTYKDQPGWEWHSCP